MLDILSIDEIMNLCIDIGNTRVKYLFYDNDVEINYHAEEAFNINTVNELVQQYHPKLCIISSTRTINYQWLEYLNANCKVYNLKEDDLEIPMVLDYETPKTLGTDRMVAAFAAKTMFPNAVSVIINAGSCITCDVVDAEGIYQGGNISPGIKMRLQAMHEFTDALPLVHIEYHKELLGKSTVKALQNGAVKGALYEVESFLQEIMLNYEKPNIIVTGGDSKIFAKHLKFKIFAVPNLILFGLNNILRYNADQ